MQVSRVLAILLALATAAAAQPVATERPKPVLPRSPSGLGGDLVFGWGGQRGGPDGFIARYENELFPVFAASRGRVLGFMTGIEYWRSGADNFGFSVPLVIAGGLRVFPIRALAGLGFDMFVVDQVDNDTGVGSMAPLAMVRLGVDIFGFQLGADARIGYRTQLGAPDHTRWQLGIFIGRTWQSTQPIL